jgi:hypothetical protein
MSIEKMRAYMLSNQLVNVTNNIIDQLTGDPVHKKLIVRTLQDIAKDLSIPNVTLDPPFKEEIDVEGTIRNGIHIFKNTYRFTLIRATKGYLKIDVFLTKKLTLDGPLIAGLSNNDKVRVVGILRTPRYSGRTPYIACTKIYRRNK